MEFRNQTPFSALNFMMLDKNNDENHVVVMKVGYRLEPTGNGTYRVRVRDDDAVLLCIEDEFSGVPNTSTVIQESDLAPFKPYCDVIISGTACTPGGIPDAKINTAVKLTSSAGNVLLEKHLQVTGSRLFQKNPLTRKWLLTEPEPFISLPVIWEAAFGGECRISESEEGAETIPKTARLTDVQRASHPDAPQAPLAHTVCENNPLGKGYITPWYPATKQAVSYPAPQITDPCAPLTGEQFAEQIAGQADLSAPPFQPAGFGFTGRTWQPRRALAGTFDNAWLKERHPALPADFDFQYWNAAPRDQQIPFPQLPVSVALTGFSSSGGIHFSLPEHLAFVLLRFTDGVIVPARMNLDTLHIDADKLDVSACWRFLLPKSAPIRVMEARYETEPGKLTAKLYGVTQKEITPHG